MNAESRHRLKLLPGKYAVCRLAPDAPIPDAPTHGEFFSVTRTETELSVVLSEDRFSGDSLPAGARCETGFRLLRVDGPLGFSAVGILAALVTPLAEAGIPVLSLSTFDTDYLLIREAKVKAAADALRAAGHSVAEQT